MDKNAFDVLRIFSVVQVMLLHFNAFFYLYNSAEHFKYREIVRMFPGVVIMFSLSGFLIAASCERSTSRREFFRKRVLRLYPPLWLCTVVNLIVLFLLGQNLMDISVLLWIFTQIVGIANTPSVLKGFATGSVNGALWTIFTQIQLYVVLAFTYRRLKKMTSVEWGIWGFVLLLCNLGAYYLQTIGNEILSKIIERLFLPYALWFFIGVYLYIHREVWIPRLKKIVWPLLVFFVLYKCSYIQIIGYYADIVTSICLPFITIGLAFNLGNIRIKPDLSYHMFLYHWIVLNILVYYGYFKTWNITQSLAVFFAATLGFSLFSYCFCNCCTALWNHRTTQSS